MGLKVFISYAHADKSMLKAFRKHLNLLTLGDGPLVDSIWTDFEIKAGDIWKTELLGALEECDLFLYLVSADSLFSKFCYEKEFGRATERHWEGECIIIPVILKDVAWEFTPLKHFQAVPQEARAIQNWGKHASGYTNAVKLIHKKLDEDRK
ncbi:MAG: toll/interleukin-1 receptor domain-containing protein [Rhodospirillales bacterium]|nr:toll/interleukin-1 receptor domain-containing protein [Rhodospirillales bacterium]